jgi:hypothetical protein
MSVSAERGGGGEGEGGGGIRSERERNRRKGRRRERRRKGSNKRETRQHRHTPTHTRPDVRMRRRGRRKWSELESRPRPEETQKQPSGLKHTPRRTLFHGRSPAANHERRFILLSNPAEPTLFPFGPFSSTTAYPQALKSNPNSNPKSNPDPNPNPIPNPITTTTQLHTAITCCSVLQYAFQLLPTQTRPKIKIKKGGNTNKRLPRPCSSKPPDPHLSHTGTASRLGLGPYERAK